MFEKFLEDLEKEYNEFENKGMSKEAVELRNKIGQHLNCNNYPHYFTGNLKADLVFVQLNPYEKESLEYKYKGDKKFKNFNEYFNFFSHYGQKQYRENNNFKSKFDSRQLLFLKQFGVINFVMDNGLYQNNRENLAKAVDCKLQLELVPYGSNNFKIKKSKYLERYISRILNVITEIDRKYVIFCGNVFKDLLKDYIVRNQEYKFKLHKLDGNETKNNCTYFNVIIKYQDKKMKIGIAPTYANQSINGILMEQYGQKCKQFYDEWS